MKNTTYQLILISLTLLLTACTGEMPIANTPVAVIPATTTEVAPSTLIPASVTPPLSPTPSSSPTPPPPSPTPTDTPTPRPTPVATIEVADAWVAPGFSFTLFADLYRPTSLTFDEQGRLFAASADGTIHIFTDEDGNGRADGDQTYFAGLYLPLGLTFRPGHSDELYVSSNGRISILTDPDGDGVAQGVNFVQGLPAGGLHQNNNLHFGPDGWLYMGMGSTCDVCVEADPRNATIMRFNPDTNESEIYATGLRNPFDLAFHPETGALFATDNGRDDLGPDLPREEINHILQGQDYGWPDCWDAGLGDCVGGALAITFFEAHTSADSLIFYTGDRFPPEYHHHLFVGIFGSWLKPEVDRGIMRVPLISLGNSYRGEAEWFARWPGMPLGLTMGPDGALYVGDYINDKIYRLHYGP